MHNEPQREKQDRLEIEDVITNPYAVLGLDRRATDKEIKKAYFAKVREHPPESAPEQFKRIRAAYDLLRTPEARAATDIFLLNPPLAYEPYKRPPSFSLDITRDDKLQAAKAKAGLLRPNLEDDFRDIDL